MIARVGKGVLVVLVWFISTGFAATKDYSGTYAQKTKGKSSQSTVLQVIQTEAGIEVRRTRGEKSAMNRCPLDGTEGSYTNFLGERGKCKAELKDKYLLLESVVVTQPIVSTDLPRLRLRTREWWRLSADRKILTIKTVEDFLDAPPHLSTGDPIPQDWTRTYERTDIP